MERVLSATGVASYSLLTALGLLLLVNVAQADEIKFKKTQLDDKFLSEGVAVGDFNGDGKLDIAAGDYYYAAPDWKPVAINQTPREYDPLKYSNSFANFAEDVNGDGLVDLIVVDFPGIETWWHENPGKQGRPWWRHTVVPVTNNESPLFADVTGDDRRELIYGAGPNQADSDGAARRMAIARPGTDVTNFWPAQFISQPDTEGTRRFSHGLGVGDVNGDGRKDIVIRHGWWEQPADGMALPWEFHEAPFGEECAQIIVYDFDDDGDADVLTTSAHKVGMWWHEQKVDGWETHLIDDSFTQTHAVILADINRDGLPDFVTGKRWWAHGPKGDINPMDPPVLCWFELARQDGKPSWTKHQIDDASGIGTQFEVIDVNGDGKLDIATANKRGVFFFEQE